MFFRTTIFFPLLSKCVERLCSRIFWFEIFLGVVSDSLGWIRTKSGFFPCLGIRDCLYLKCFGYDHLFTYKTNRNSLCVQAFISLLLGHILVIRYSAEYRIIVERKSICDPAMFISCQNNKNIFSTGISIVCLEYLSCR